VCTIQAYYILFYAHACQWSGCDKLDTHIRKPQRKNKKKKDKNREMTERWQPVGGEKKKTKKDKRGEKPTPVSGRTVRRLIHMCKRY
jgi:hypothetical protein